MKNAHPRTLCHDVSTLERLADIALHLSHDVDGHFDDLQDMSNLLRDWAAVRSGWTLSLLDGTVVNIFDLEPDS